jgi:predicted RNase H-like HicB family nuclease
MVVTLAMRHNCAAAIRRAIRLDELMANMQEVIELCLEELTDEAETLT